VSVAIGIQNEMRMCRIILSSVTSLAVPNVYTLSHNCTIVGKND